MTGSKRTAKRGAGLKAAEEDAAAEAAREVARPALDQAFEATSPAGAQDASHLVVGPGSRDALIRAEHVEFSQGGASRVEATTVSLSQGGAGRIKAREVSITQGGAGVVQAGTLRLESDANAFLVVSRNAEVAPGARVAVLLSGRTFGGTRPLLDSRSAFALGAGYLLLRRLLSVVRRR